MWHMEVPRLGAELELQLPAYTTATAILDLSCSCDLHHSSLKRQVLNPLSEARDPTHNLMVISQAHFCCATIFVFFFFFFFVFCLFVFVVVAISLAAPAAYGGSQARG